MILTWVLWPFVVLLAVLLRASWVTLQRWRLILMLSVATFPAFFLAFPLLADMELDKQHLNDPPSQYALVLRWWDRWRSLGVARLLPNYWSGYRPPYPTNTRLFVGLMHVCLAASLTIATLVVLLVFLWSMVISFSAFTEPFGEDSHR